MWLLIARWKKKSLLRFWGVVPLPRCAWRAARSAAERRAERLNAPVGPLHPLHAQAAGLGRVTQLSGRPRAVVVALGEEEQVHSRVRAQVRAPLGRAVLGDGGGVEVVGDRDAREAEAVA